MTGEPAHRGHKRLHILEAQSVATFGAGAQIEIQLGHVCNNRCVFCVSGQMTEQRLAGTIDTAPVLRELEAAAARGAKKLTILGGEPTLQRSFLPALRRAVELEFEEIVIFTNGVKTRRRSFVDELVALGRFTWRFSIQGGNEAAHDRVTQKQGAFARIIEGMRHLKELGQRVTANACINEHSYRSLPDFPALIQAHDITQLHLDMIRPSDAGVRTDEYLRAIMPRYADMAPYFREMLEGFEAIDPEFDVNVGNYPYCLLPEWSHKIHHDGEATMTVAADGANELSKPWNKYEVKRVDKRHPPQCDACVFKPQCNGIFDKYAQFYGHDEFVPVSRARLRALDPRLHHFTLLVEPHLLELVRGEPPGWRATRLHRSSRDRFVELSLTARTDEGPLTATLVLTPPAGAGAPVDSPPVVLETDRFRVGLRLEGRPRRAAELAAVAALLRWLAARVDDMSKQPGDSSRDQVDAPPVTVTRP
ncbi:MAG: radical SAM protein, partial [Myxococcales bacterium]|nr:radical SAM protein [Myxococcales bacterium]